MLLSLKCFVKSLRQSNKSILSFSVQSAQSMASKSLIFMRTEISNYCQVSSAPSLPANAAVPNYVTTVNSVTTYSCNYGYSGSVSITCLQYTASSGVWSAISGSCTGTLYTLQLIQILNCL